MLRLVLGTRLLATAAKGKGAPAAQLKKKIKHAFQTKSRQVKKSSRSVDDSPRFKEALFAVPPEKSQHQVTKEELEKREIIAKAWSRYCWAKEKAIKMHEYFFLASKIRAMQELQAANPALAERAREIDYTLPPPRKLPSIVAPTLRINEPVIEVLTLAAYRRPCKMSDLAYISRDILAQHTAPSQPAITGVSRVIAGLDLAESDSDLSDVDEQPSFRQIEPCTEGTELYDEDGDLYSLQSNKNEEFIDRDPALFEFPPVLDETCTIEYLGVVHAILPEQIIIQSTIIHSPLDMKSLLCTPDRRVVGRVCETFGPVSNPFYVVSTAALDSEHPLAVGMKIFYSPQFMNIVPVSEISRRRGCDASNQFDHELAESEIECSDDEQEQSRRREQRKKRTITNEEICYGEATEHSQPLQHLSLKDRADFDIQSNVSLQY